MSGQVASPAGITRRAARHRRALAGPSVSVGVTVPHGDCERS
ncbi:MAG TPA: hypothetical protein VM734_25075 [Kofleriaceae bacterium]|nr:hypothetical protein [Kofleriaceae bacterium]